MEKQPSNNTSVSSKDKAKLIENLINELAELNGLKQIQDNLYVGKQGSYFIKTKIGFRLAKFAEI